MTMSGYEIDKSNAKNFIHIVEEIRLRRRMEHGEPSRQSHSELPEQPIKTYTLDEINEVYSGYKDLKRERIERPPSRGMVAEIIKYLECESDSARIYVAAGYIPDLPEPNEKTLKAGFDIAQDVVNSLPLPAFYIDRQWFIHGWNKYAEILFQITPEDIAKVPEEKRHVLRFLFDPELIVYRRFRGNLAHWEYTVELNIYGFTSSNLLFANTPWYKKLVEDLKELPEFARIWNRLERGEKPLQDVIKQRSFPTYSTEVDTHDEKIWVLGTHTSVGNFDYPIIVSYIPYDDEARKKFAKIGLPVLDNTWGSQGQ